MSTYSGVNIRREHHRVVCFIGVAKEKASTQNPWIFMIFSGGQCVLNISYIH